MEIKLPNLELLIYKARMQLYLNKDYLKQHGEEKRMEFDVEVFSQYWGSTALGFDTWGGQSMTKAYTTVVHETNSDFYCVFFGDQIAYIVYNPSEKFLEDLKNHRMEDVRQAHLKY